MKHIVFLSVLMSFFFGNIEGNSASCSIENTENANAVTAISVQNDADTTVVPNKQEEIFEIVDQEAEYPGGEKALFAYVYSHCVYPAVALEKDIQGTVYLRFVVEKDGSVGEVKVTKSLHPACDAEAVRVVKTFGRFKPGMLNGSIVRSWFTLPVRFAIMQIPESSPKDRVIVGDKVVETTEEIYTVTEKPAEYPGGEQALRDYIRKTIRYPAIAQEQGIQGTVVVGFVVEKDGSVNREIKVAKSLDGSCDKEAIRVVKTLKKFKPAEINDRPVRSWMLLPISFKLR